jgi:hypothetical protein
MSPDIPNMKWRLLTTVWVSLVDIVVAAIFILFLFDMWTERPLLQRMIIQGLQTLTAFGLIIGLVLEFRHSRRAALWNVSAQLAAAIYLCGLFAFSAYAAKQNGFRIDGIEVMLIVIYGACMFVGCGLTRFLYSRSKPNLVSPPSLDSC